MQQVLRGEILSPPPVWLLRQAGRYLPEYRSIRRSSKDFLSLCLNPEMSCEVTMQPIRRFDLDAAILFSDILILPYALGQNVWFEEGEGPRLEPIATRSDLEKLRSVDRFESVVSSVAETVRLIRSALPIDKSLIGFAGSPWTVATYMIAGRGKDDQVHAKSLMATDRRLFSEIIDLLVHNTCSYLSRQIENGADVVMLFDSWAGSLSHDEAMFQEWCFAPNADIAARIRLAHPHVPVIYFPRGASVDQVNQIAQSRSFSCISLGEDINANAISRSIVGSVAFQGNLDPQITTGLPDAVESAVTRNLESFSGLPHIFNLGHGITPNGKIGNVQKILSTVRGCSDFL